MIDLFSADTYQGVQAWITANPVIARVANQKPWTNTSVGHFKTNSMGSTGNLRSKLKCPITVTKLSPLPNPTTFSLPNLNPKPIHSVRMPQNQGDYKCPL